MTRNLLLVLFVALMGGRALGLDIGLGPGMSVKNAMLYAAASLIVIDGAIARNRKVELLSVILPFGLLIAYAAMSWILIVIFQENPLYSPIQTLIRLKVKLVDQLVVLLVFFYGVVSWKDALWVLKALAWVVVVGCLITVIDTFNIPDLGIITVREEDGRIEGIVGSAGEFGGLIAYFFPAIAALWWTASGKRKFFALVGIGLALVSIMLSATRGGMLGLVLGAIVGTIWLRKYMSGVIIVRATIALLALIVVSAVVVLSTDFGSLLQARLTTGFETGEVESISSGRTQIWAGALREMSAAPWSFITGLGWESYYQSLGRRYATHNVYLDLLYNLGIIGLAFFTTTVIAALTILRRALVNAPAEAVPFLLATIIGMIAFMIAMLFADIQIAATYVWASVGVALRIAVASYAGSHGNLKVQSAARRWNRDQTKMATRPMSATPRR